MYPLLTEELVRARIRELHREAASHHLAAQVRRNRSAEAGALARVATTRRLAGRLLISLGTRLSGTAVPMADWRRVPGAGGR
jgi:hypothetical protein